MSPKYIVMDAPDLIQNLRDLANNVSFPSLDVDAALDSLIEPLRLCDEESRKDYLVYVCDEMAYGDGLFGINTLTAEESEKVFDVTLSLGFELSRQFDALGFYKDAGKAGMVKFEYHASQSDILVLREDKLEWLP